MSKMGATRDGYGEALLQLASNPKVVVLEADLGKSTKSLHFRKAHPERTVSCGIGEQNMLLVGAGLAARALSCNDNPVQHHLAVRLIISHELRVSAHEQEGNASVRTSFVGVSE